VVTSIGGRPMLECAGEESPGGGQVPLLGDQHVDDLPVLVDRAVEVDPPPGGLDVDTPRESVVKRRQFRVLAKRLFRGRACWFGSSARVGQQLVR
jgi:hypothetical protein